MLKIYFKQAIEMLKQNKLFSIISVLGTALAIMMIMSMIVAEEIKNVSISPEIHRDRTYYIKYQTLKDTTAGNHISNAGSIEYQIFKDYLLEMQTPEYISMVGSGFSLVGKESSKETESFQVCVTDADYWKILNFSFIEGTPFGAEEVQSGIAEAVISETVARKVFRGEKALGQTIMIDFKPYRVRGIVRDVSRIFDIACADVWKPINSGGRGGYGQVFFTVKKQSDIAEAEREIRAAEKRHDANNPNKALTFRGPESHRLYSMSLSGFNNEEITKNAKAQQRKSVVIFLILLLIPAVNLSGLSLSRIKKRMAEIGVRKAFGAKRHVILIQVLSENLITSLLGGVIGLGLSFFAVYRLRTWLLKIPEDSFIPMDAFVSFPVFIAVFLVCILINLLSAGIPAYRAAKMQIVSSLNENDR